MVGLLFSVATVVLFKTRLAAVSLDMSRNVATWVLLSCLIAGLATILAFQVWVTMAQALMVLVPLLSCMALCYR